jgi:hypothetical protein
MKQPKFTPNRWYLYQNGDYKEIFFCQDIDGEHLMIDRKRGYSSLLCRPVSKAYRFLHWKLIRYIHDNYKTENNT